MIHGPEWYTASAWLMRRRLAAASALVAFANRLARKWTDQTPTVWPLYRAVDTHIPGIGDHKHACAAYSYEGLKALVEQDGPDGFGATATVRWLISDEGWQSFDGMSLADIKATFAANDMEVSTWQKIPRVPWWRRIVFVA